MILEYEDIAKFIPKLAKDLEAKIRKEIEEEVFITYPEGMQRHLCDGEVSQRTYQRVHKLWNSEGFPRKELTGIKGVYLSDLKSIS